MGIFLAPLIFRTKVTLRDRSFLVTAPNLRNALLTELGAKKDINPFHCHLKTHLLELLILRTFFNS